MPNTMASAVPILTLQIPAYKSATHVSPAGGTFVLTIPAPKIYLLTFDSPPDNRLTPPFLTTFNLALDIMTTKLPPGVLITTSAGSRFYSNGLDFPAASADPEFMPKYLYPLWRKLLTFPWPTIALMNGAAFSGGLTTALAHDYRVMHPTKSALCLNEVIFNAALTPAMSTIYRTKLSMDVFRTLILESKRFNGEAAFTAGMVDGLGGFDECLSMIETLGLTTTLRPAGVGSYGLIKEEMYKDILADLDLGVEGETRVVALRARERELRRKAAKHRVKDWVAQGGTLGSVQ